MGTWTIDLWLELVGAGMFFMDILGLTKIVENILDGIRQLLRTVVGLVLLFFISLLAIPAALLMVIINPMSMQSVRIGEIIFAMASAFFALSDDERPSLTSMAIAWAQQPRSLKFEGLCFLLALLSIFSQEIFPMFSIVAPIAWIYVVLYPVSLLLSGVDKLGGKRGTVGVIGFIVVVVGLIFQFGTAGFDLPFLQ